MKSIALFFCSQVTQCVAIIGIVATPFWLFLWFLEYLELGEMPFSFVEYLVILGVISLGTGVGLFIIYLRQTSARAGDPYRFSRTQCRQVILPEKIAASHLATSLEALGYIEVRWTQDGHESSVVGKRLQTFDRQSDGINEIGSKHRWKRRSRWLSFSIKAVDNGCLIEMCAAPIVWYEYGDMTQSTYFLLEEALEYLGWKSYAYRATD